MTPELPAAVDPAGNPLETWPITLTGVVETIITTKQPDDIWHHAAMGLEPAPQPSAATGRTWGDTRTAQNLQRTERAVIQFLADPLVFVEAALGTYRTTAPVSTASGAWVRATATCETTGRTAGTGWRDWQFVPQRGAVRERHIPTIRRGRAAVIDAAVAASRLAVDSYETASLWERIDYDRTVVNRCGNDREQRAFARLLALVDQDPPF